MQKSNPRNGSCYSLLMIILYATGKKQRNYFILNKRSDYEKSAYENMEYDENGIWIPADSVKNRGVFLSRIFDSREPEMEWHRLVLKVTDARILDLCMSSQAL